jgi:hypothetical protein
MLNGPSVTPAEPSLDEPLGPDAGGAPSPWYRRTSTLLLAGWCVSWLAWIGSGVAGLHGCPRGQEGCYQGPMLAGTGRWWLLAAAGALLLLGLCLLERRRPAIGGVPAEPRRYRRRWIALGSIAGTVVGAHLVMFGPMVDKPFCARPVHVNSAMAYVVNCDSGEFLRLANHPKRILQYHHSRQSRPGYVAVSAVAAVTLGPVTHALRLDRLYRQTDRAYLPLVLINLAATCAAIAVLAWLLAGLGTPRPATVALCGLVAVNEVTKAFTWTPHQQTFALLVPVATIAAARWLLLARPAWPKVAVLGLVVGGASLVYGSFLITVAVAVPILLARKWRGVLLAGCFAAAFAAPQLAWIALCKAITGDYYNMEAAEYDEFIWLLKAAQHGGDALWTSVLDMSVTTVREFFVAGTVGLLLIAALAALAVLLRVRLGAIGPEQRATLIATALTIAAAVLFAWGIGIIASRLMFHAMPALLIVVGWLAARIATTSPRAARTVAVGIAAAAAASITADIVAYGPYS